ncbi:hypothetical protein GH714_002408 [Hevea brasiliensis]|uniref:Protein transport protein Sec61 subunit beta n=1 Tax=Hevea brasiliensis TaxID=3981 RepID=A0A6A6K7C4_HEVBR|nr:hypothetical protein GH714_002408 [Hevea brasiliensis]
MARGTSQSQTASSSTSRPGVMAPRGSAAATAGLRRRRLGSSASGSASGAAGGLGGGSSNMLRFYTDDAPGLKISPTIVLVMSLCFIGFVTALHVFGKLYRGKKSELAAMEKNRASGAAMNAEVKGLSKEEIGIRPDLVLALPERIQAIPDGTTVAAKQTGGWAGSTPNKNVKFDSSDEHLQDDFFQQSEESSQFRHKYEMRNLKQACLDFILEGLDTLKNLAHDMNEVDEATLDLRNTNVRLKKTIVEYIEMNGFHGLVLLFDHNVVWYNDFHHLWAFSEFFQYLKHLFIYYTALKKFFHS